MNNSTRYLLTSVLAISPVMIAVHSSAETVIESDAQVREKFSLTSSKQIAPINASSRVDNPDSSATNAALNSTNRNQIISETGSQVSDSSSTVAERVNSLNQRVPLSSRIFATPSMQQ